MLIISWLFWGESLLFIPYSILLMKLSSKIIDGARKTLPTCLGFSLLGDRKGYKWKKSDCGQNWFMITLIYLLIQQYMHACSAATTAAKLPQSCLTLCNHIDGSPLGSTIPGILQARTLEWVAIAFSNAWKWSHSVISNSSRPHGLQPTRLLYPWDFPGKSTGVGCHCLLCVHAQSCPTLCDSMDCSPQDSSVRGILQTRILEWVAIYFLP